MIKTAPPIETGDTAASTASVIAAAAHEQQPPGEAPANEIPDVDALPVENTTSAIARPRLADIIGEPLVNGKIRCPFHDDHTPSLHVYEDHYHCFVCGAHG